MLWVHPVLFVLANTLFWLNVFADERNVVCAQLRHLFGRQVHRYWLRWQEGNPVRGRLTEAANQKDARDATCHVSEIWLWANGLCPLGRSRLARRQGGCCCCVKQCTKTACPACRLLKVDCSYAYPWCCEVSLYCAPRVGIGSHVQRMNL